MSEFNIPNFAEQRLTCRALVLASQNASDGMMKFIQWLLAGFAAGVTYLIGQTTTHIQVETLKYVALLFLAAALFGVVQRYFAMLVGIGSKVFQEGEKLHDNNVRVDLAQFLIIYIDSLPVWSRWAAAWTAEKFMDGNLTATGRGLLNLAIIQCLLGFVTTILLLDALYQVVCSLWGV